MEEREMALMPTDTKPSPYGRLLKEMAVYELLDKLEIPYMRVDHERADTVEACHNVDQVLGIHICKNLFLCNAQKTDFYLLMMPGDKKFKTKELSSQIHSARLSFAGAEFMEEFLNITPGSVSVLGLMNDNNNRVRLLIDQDVLRDSYVGCHPCVNTSSLKIKTEDLLNKFLPYTAHEYTVVKLTGGNMIRTMTIDDYEGVKELWLSIKGFAIRSLDDSREGVARFLERNPSTSVVAVEDGRIVGAILCGHDGRRGCLYHVCVAEEYRMRGIGKQMVVFCMEALKAEQINKVSLIAFTANDIGNAFWRTIGWTKREDLNYYDFTLNEKNITEFNKT